MLLLPARREERLRDSYRGQLLWLIAAQLSALSGAGDFAVPDYLTLFPPPEDRLPPVSAQRVKRDVLRRLRSR